MIYAIWGAMVVLAAVLTLVGLFYDVPGCFLLAGVFWVVAAFGSVDVEFSVVYKTTGYDYLKDFTYPYLSLFFGVIGLSELAYFGLRTLTVMQEAVEL